MQQDDSGSPTGPSDTLDTGLPLQQSNDSHWYDLVSYCAGCISDFMQTPDKAITIA